MLGKSATLLESRLNPFRTTTRTPAAIARPSLMAAAIAIACISLAAHAQTANPEAMTTPEAAAPKAAPEPAAPEAAKSTASDAMTPDVVNDATLASAVGAGAKGAAVLRAQILLDRAHFSPGEIDGVYGSSMQRAISGYQAAKGLPVTGTVDSATWTALNADNSPVLDVHDITAEDVAGPFVALPTDMMEKAKLQKLGYTSATEALGEQFHASPALLVALNPGKDLGKPGERIIVPRVDASAAIPGVAKVVVDKSDSTVTLVDAEGKTLAQWPASTGSEHDPLPIGEWKIQGIAKNPVFNYNPDLFWDGNPKHSKAKLPAGPNNPVGVVWVDLSKEHYGIHGTPEPSKVGKTESHGCIRLTNWTALVLAESVKSGMTALLQD